MCVSACQACIGAHGNQKRASDPLTMEMQEVVSCLTWVLQSKLRSAGTAPSDLNLWAICPAHFCYYCYYYCHRHHFFSKLWSEPRSDHVVLKKCQHFLCAWNIWKQSDSIMNSYVSEWVSQVTSVKLECTCHRPCCNLYISVQCDYWRLHSLSFRKAKP